MGGQAPPGLLQGRSARARWEVAPTTALKMAIDLCKKVGDLDEYGEASLGGAGTSGGVSNRVSEAYVSVGAAACAEAETTLWSYQGHILKKIIVREPPALPTVTAVMILGFSGEGKMRADWQPGLEPVQQQDSRPRLRFKLPTFTL